jgi:phosphatase NudJ
MDNRWRPSVTVAAVIERDGRFLLVEEETSVGGLRLNNPAGHLDPGESPPEGCARETLEETAWHFEPTHLLGIYMSRFQKASNGEDITYLRFAFTGQLGAHEKDRKLDHGIVRTLWMTADEIRANKDRLRSPLVLRCVEDYLAGVRYPLDALHVDPSVFGPL